MKFKKVFMVFLAVILVCTAFAGCIKSSSETTSGSSVQSTFTEKTTGTNTETTAAQEIKEIIVTYLTMGTTPKDLGLVQDAVNEITEKEIGVRVKFYPMSAYDTISKYGVLLAGGERIDLMMLLLTPMNSFVVNGSLKPLGSLIESYGKDLIAFDEKYGIFGKIDGEIYTIMPVGLGGAFQGAYYVKENLFKNAKLELKNGIYTYDDLTEVFAAIKNSNPEIYPYGATGPNSKASYTQFAFLTMVDAVGAYNSGVLLDTKSTKLVNMFESKEYHDFLTQVRKWFESGYVLPDAATNQTPITTLVDAGTTAGYPMANTPIIVSSTTKAWGGVVILPTTEKFRASSMINGGWAVPITSKEPEAAIKFMNYLYTHDDLTNLIQWGIEGKHIEVVDKENGVITFADGLDVTTSPYYNSLGLWGNQINAYVWDPVGSKKFQQAFFDECSLNPTKAVGFNYYSPAELQNISIVVDEVLNQYMPTLETGSAKNLEAVYQEFIAKLKAAGIDKLIEDKQAKFDAWLNSKK